MSSVYVNNMSISNIYDICILCQLCWSPVKTVAVTSHSSHYRVYFHKFFMWYVLCRVIKSRQMQVPVAIFVSDDLHTSSRGSLHTWVLSSHACYIPPRVYHSYFHTVVSSKRPQNVSNTNSLITSIITTFYKVTASTICSLHSSFSFYLGIYIHIFSHRWLLENKEFSYSYTLIPLLLKLYSSMLLFIS